MAASQTGPWLVDTYRQELSQFESRITEFLLLMMISRLFFDSLLRQPYNSAAGFDLQWTMA
jgi:hypothetical protein